MESKTLNQLSLSGLFTSKYQSSKVMTSILPLRRLAQPLAHRISFCFSEEQKKGPFVDIMVGDCECNIIFCNKGGKGKLNFNYPHICQKLNTKKRLSFYERFLEIFRDVLKFLYGTKLSQSWIVLIKKIHIHLMTTRISALPLSDWTKFTISMLKIQWAYRCIIVYGYARHAVTLKDDSTKSNKPFLHDF